MSDKKTLTCKLLEVSKAIKYLEKDKTNKMQGYSYLSEAKIKETIKKAFEDNGILFNYSTENVREYEISATSKGTKQFCTIVNGKYSFMDVDSDHELNGTWFGSGTDTGDKGLYKAITGGIKYVLNTNFLIPTGDDPENNDDNENGNGKAAEKAIGKATITDKSGNNGNGSKLESLLSLAFTSDKTRKSFVDSFNGDEEQMIKVLTERINKEINV